MTSKKISFMDKIQAFMEKSLVPIAMKISSQRHLGAIRDGMTVLIPMTVIGGFACLLAIPPIPAGIEPTNFFNSFLSAWQKFSIANRTVLMLPYRLTIGILSVYVVFGIAYQLAKKLNMDSLNNALAALLVFLCVSGAVDLETNSISIARLGAGYMFGGMLIALAVVEINHFFIKRNIRIKMPEAVPNNVAAPFNLLIPLIFNVVLFSLLNVISTKFTGDSLTNLTFALFQPILRASGSLPSILFINFLASIFWFFGIHGQSMVAVVVNPIVNAGLAANLEAYSSNQPLEHIFAGYANNVFGAWMCYVALIIAMLLFAKSSQIRSLSKVATVPTIFNVNEPLIFGIPTVLNVYMFAGLNICMIINFTTYYLLASAGIVGRFFMTMPFTTPGPIAAFIATMDWKVSVLWFILLAIDVAVMYPFMRAYDTQLLKAETSVD